MSQPNAPLARRGMVSIAPLFWVVVVLTGVGAGVAGGALMLLLYLVQHLSFGYTEETFLQGVEQASAARRVLVLAIAGLLAGAGWWLLRSVLGPSRGVSEAVWNAGGRMPLIRTALDGVLQIVIVGMGASLGREGAPREAGAAIGSRLSELTGLSDNERRLIMACGAGAGLAAVYNVPLGGALFTLEVLLGSLSIPLFVPAAATSIVATTVAWLLLPNRPTYTVAPFPLTISIGVFAVVAGPVCGLAAVGIVRLVALARASKPQRWRLLVATTLVFTAIGALAIPFPQLLGNGKGPTQLTFDGAGGLGLVAVLFLLKPVVTAACLRSGATGGLFTPTLATGALLGATLGHLWSLLWPGTPLGAFAVLGAAAVLAAALQAPISAVVLVLELTRVGPGFLVPMVVAVIGATVTARLLESRSTYTVGWAADAVDPPGIPATRPPKSQPP